MDQVVDDRAKTNKNINHITIGKMAKINGISEQTLRLYDKMKLLQPSEINAETGYRYYNIKQCAQLDKIQYFKSLGMNLSQIKEVFEQKDVGTLRRILKYQRDILSNQIEELQLAKKAIERDLEKYNRYDAAPEEGVVILEYIKERKFFCYDTKINCYSYGMDYYEHVVRNLKKSYVLHKLPNSYFCYVGSKLRKECFQRGELWATELLLFIEEEFLIDEGVETIPEGLYLCVYCYGFDKEESSIKTLMDYVSNHNYKVQGDCITEVLIEFPTFNHYDRNAFLKMQVPVKQKNKKIY